MVALYVKRIKAGQMTLAQVPKKWRAAVEEALANDPEYNPQ